jgi:hypothetical protein
MSLEDLADPGLTGVFGADDRAGFTAAKARILAYWSDECARDLNRLLAHFAGNAEVVTPDGRYHGRAAIAELYKKSFEGYPGLKVDVKASFVGRGAHCFEYSAVLTDRAANSWLIEGINLVRLEGALIGSLRSFEDAPRRISAGGDSR